MLTSVGQQVSTLRMDTKSSAAIPPCISRRKPVLCGYQDRTIMNQLVSSLAGAAILTALASLFR